MLRNTLTTTLFLIALAGTAQAFPGQDAPCPSDAKKEVAIIPFARTDISPCFCNTIITCMNLDKAPRVVRVQFFSKFTGAQEGNDAATVISPGVAINFSATGTDPLGV